MAKAKEPDREQFERELAALTSMTPQAIRAHRRPNGNSYFDETLNLCWKVWQKALKVGQREPITRKRRRS